MSLSGCRPAVVLAHAEAHPSLEASRRRAGLRTSLVPAEHLRAFGQHFHRRERIVRIAIVTRLRARDVLHAELDGIEPERLGHLVHHRFPCPLRLLHVNLLRCMGPAAGLGTGRGPPTDNGPDSPPWVRRRGVRGGPWVMEPAGRPEGQPDVQGEGRGLPGGRRASRASAGIIVRRRPGSPDRSVANV